MAAPGETNSSASPSHKRGLILAVASVAVAAALVLNRLEAAGVCGANEAVEGIFVQQMVEHGKVLFPLENGHSPMYKPPLFHWTATAVDHLLGVKKVTAFNLRLTAALYAVAGVILTISFSRNFIGYDGAWLAGLIVCGSYQYIEQREEHMAGSATCLPSRSVSGFWPRDRLAQFSPPQPAAFS